MTLNPKLLSVLLLSTMAGSVFCTESNQVYSSTVNAHNAPMVVDIVMKDGKITNILTDDRESDGVGKKVIKDLSRQIIKNQTLNVDNVTGATFTSLALKEGVRNGLKQAGADLSKWKTPVPQKALKPEYS